jgi:glycosyltransferase involved in cell wall biosynthesis
MRKVLIIITTAFVHYGGLTTVMMNYYRAMDKHGLQIDFAADNQISDELLRELQENNSSYIQLPNRKKVFQYVRQLSKVLHEYDVVHVNGNSATMLLETLPAVWCKKKKVIVHSHNSCCTHKIFHFLCKSVFSHTYTDALACSDVAGEWIFGRGNYEVLNNAIDLEKFAYNSSLRMTVRKELGISDEQYVIGQIAKMSEQKNHELSIELFYRVYQTNHNATLMLVGDGNLRGKIQQMVKEKGLDNAVIFTGMRKDNYRLLQAMDVFILPSKWEGLPLAVLEAQANGLRCIVSDKVSKQVAVLDNLEFCPIEQAEQLWANAVGKMVSSRVGQEEINLRFREKGFEIKTEANKLRELYMNTEA